MKSKFTTFIMTLIILLITVILMVFGLLLVQELTREGTEAIAKDFISNYEPEREEIEQQNLVKTPEMIESKLNESTNKQEEDDNKVYVNQYFYNQLEEEAKTIYRALESNKEKMKTGNHEVNLGTNFTSLLTSPDGDKKLGEYYQSAIEAYFYDNPQVFYLSANKMYLNIERTTRAIKTSYRVFINQGNESNYLIDGFDSDYDVKEAISRIEQVKNQIVASKKATTEQNIKMVHNYLVDQVNYDTSISKANIYNIYGTLVKGEAVCEGYAKSFKYLMDALGIQSTMVIGEGTNSKGQRENHAWNYVQIEEKWYAIDTTWDDPIIIGGGNASYASRYRYYLKGGSTFRKDHIASGQFTTGGKVFSYPIISENDY